MKFIVAIDKYAQGTFMEMPCKLSPLTMPITEEIQVNMTYLDVEARWKHIKCFMAQIRIYLLTIVFTY